MLGAYAAAATSPIRIKPAIYQPTIMIGWAIVKGILRAMLKRSAMLAMIAKTNDTALIPINLERRSAWSTKPYSKTHHGGSGTSFPLFSLNGGTTDTRQCDPIAHTLKALAMGPNVPWMLT